MHRLPYVFLGSFLITIFLLQWWVLSVYPIALWIVLIIVAMISIIAGRGLACQTPTASTLGIIIAFIAVSHAADRGIFPILEQYLGQKTITIEGTVTGQPDDRGTQLQTVLAMTGTRILLIDKYTGVIPQPGDRLRVSGKLIKAEAGSSYERYLRMRNIGATMDVRSIDIIDAGNPSIQRTLWRIKLRFQDHLHHVLTEPASGLLDGLLTGNNGGLSQSIQQDFRTTGLSHIVAVSGSNITVVLSVLGSLLFFLPLRWRFLPCAVGIVLFTLFVGASASVTRAAITGIIGLIALQTGRQNDARLAMLWTAFAMLCWNPWMLWADAGFQLSFLAVIGLIELTPFIEPLLTRVPKTGGIREALTATLAAQVTAVPWGIALFGSLPVISPLSNVLVAPFIPLAMLTGSLALLIGFLMPPLAVIAGFPAALLLNTIITTAHLLALVPAASVILPAFPSWLMGLYYLLLAMSIVLLHRHRGPAVQAH